MATGEDTPELGLSDYLAVLRRRKGVIALALVVVVGATLAASYLQTKVYQGTAEVLLQSTTVDNPLSSPTGQTGVPAADVQTQIEVLTSQPVRDAVAKQLGSAPTVTVVELAQTDIIQVKAQSTDPQRAATVADAYANAYIAVRRTKAIDNLVAVGTQLQSRVTDLQKQIDALDARLNAGSAADRALANQNLGPQRDALVNQQGLLKQQLDQIQVESALQTGGAQLVTPATVPTSPIKPRPKRNAVIAVAVGLVFGVGVAFLFEYLDDSIKDRDDLDRAAAGVPNVGAIPLVSGWKAGGSPEVVSISKPTSPAAEAYRGLRTSVRFLGLDHPVRSLQLTSPAAGEGKTTTLANLGVALARTGQSVCLVCCDLRRPRIHEFFGLSNELGLTSVLLGERPLVDSLKEVPGEDRLAVLASGPLPPDPSELLSSPRMGPLIDNLKEHFDVLLFDSPPLLPVTDAAVLAPRMDATLLVVTAGVTTRREVRRAVELLRQVNAPLVGTVLNSVSEQVGYSYGRGNYAYYGPTASSPADSSPADSSPAANGSGANNGSESLRARWAHSKEK